MIELKCSTNDKFFFVVKATNGKNLVTSQLYTRKGNANNGVSALQNVMDKANRKPVIDRTNKRVKYPGKK